MGDDITMLPRSRMSHFADLFFLRMGHGGVVRMLNTVVGGEIASVYIGYVPISPL